MISPLILDIEEDNDSKRMIIVEPLLERYDSGVAATGSYKLYKSSVDNQSALFTEVLEIDEKNDGLPDERNPDYLGCFTIEATGKWHYQGGLLNQEEQQQLAKHVKELISS
jgi:VCBS repeat-containing protein